MTLLLLHKLLGYWENKRAVDISDEFILRLRQLNTGMLVPGNLLCFQYAISHLPSTSPILEIGAFCGLSTNVMTYYKRLAGVRNDLITVDKWDYSFKGLTDKELGRSGITGEEWGRFARQTFLNNVQFFSRADLPKAIEAYSDEFFEMWERGVVIETLFGDNVSLGGRFSFCYIDGDHSYRQVKRDFENVDRFLEKDGFIFFDDSADFSGSPGVQMLIRELLQRRIIGRRYKVVMKNPNYLIQKIVAGTL